MNILSSVLDFSAILLRFFFEFKFLKCRFLGQFFLLKIFRWNPTPKMAGEINRENNERMIPLIDKQRKLEVIEENEDYSAQIIPENHKCGYFR